VQLSRRFAVLITVVDFNMVPIGGEQFIDREVLSLGVGVGQPAVGCFPLGDNPRVLPSPFLRSILAE
jgi:hypothetical protein